MDGLQLAQEFERYRSDRTLLAEVHLEQRAQALAHISLMQEVARRQRDWPGWPSLLEAASVLQAQINRVNQALFQSVRYQIQQGDCRGKDLAQLLRRFTATPSVADPTTRYYQPDGLDHLISGVLALATGPGPQAPLPPGMVHYERTPARAILALVERVPFPPQSVFYDLGSGLGEVPILVHLLTGVQTKGVEIEADFCRFAQQQIANLQLSGVTILNADARTLDYRDGDIIFMFTPFYGTVLQAVLDRLQQQAQQRPLTLCTYGPCTPHVAQQPWLTPFADSLSHEFTLALFRSKS